jgi:hypothetical protein
MGIFSRVEALGFFAEVFCVGVARGWRPSPYNAGGWDVVCAVEPGRHLRSAPQVHPQPHVRVPSIGYEGSADVIRVKDLEQRWHSVGITNCCCFIFCFLKGLRNTSLFQYCFLKIYIYLVVLSVFSCLAI